MILNYLDRHTVIDDGKETTFGVGHELLRDGVYRPEEQELTAGLLTLCRQYNGDGVVAIDGGANIGALTVPWARLMTGWGRVLAFEAQERLFYALAGNVAINNLWNVRAFNQALGLGKTGDSIIVPQLDFTKPSTFGSLELRELPSPEDIGQPVNRISHAEPLRLATIDCFELQRLDLLKLDIEGMEIEAIAGALETIRRCKPVMMIEWLKVGKETIRSALGSVGYECFDNGHNILAVHQDSKVLAHVRKIGE